MNETIFQSVVDGLRPILPEKWESVIYRADYTEGSYSMKYYVDFGDGKYIDCFKLEKLSKQQILATFRSINKTISTERQNLPDKERWSVMTMMIAPSGRFKTDFDYRDISENMISYQAEWEQRYLGK